MKLCVWRALGAAALIGGAVAASGGTSQAMPLNAGQFSSFNPSLLERVQITDRVPLRGGRHVRGGRGWGGGGHAWRGGHWRGRYRGGHWGGAGLGFGLATGALIGSAIAAERAQASSAEIVAYCSRRFKSYDPRTGTYLGYDGYRHPCP